MKVKLFDMPLGSRFRYEGKEQVFVLLDYGGSGKVCDAPNDFARNMNRVQGMYSAAESRHEFCELMVEFVPVQEATSAKSVTTWERSDDSPLQA